MVGELVRYDPYQRIFTMSMLANRAMNMHEDEDVLVQRLSWVLSHYMTGAKTPPKEKYAPADILDGVAHLMGRWELIWGPTVYPTASVKHVGLYDATNAAFIARCPLIDEERPDLPTVYVVGVAATNPASMDDIFVQDGDVDLVVPWEKFDPTQNPKNIACRLSGGDGGAPYISAGTAHGLNDVWTKLTAPDWAPGAGKNIIDSLKSLDLSQDKNGSVLVFAGHSLAAALTPMMALYLVEREPELAGRFNAVYAYPTAGATPGNKAVADLFSSKLPPDSPYDEGKPYRVLNVRIWNSIDVVPHAWAQESHTDWDGHDSPEMQSIAGLYKKEPLAPDPEGVEPIVECAMHRANTSGMKYHTLPGAMLFSSPTSHPKDIDGFFKELLYQHIAAYLEHLILTDGIPQIKGE